MTKGNANDAKAYGEGPGPNPKLGSLDRPVGAWEKSDPSEAGTADGRTSFEWMEGGHFPIRRVDFTVSRGTEIIGHDEESGTLRLHYFGNGGGVREYACELEDDTLTASMDMPRAEGSFVGIFSEDGDSVAGRREWAHDAVTTRAGER